MNGEIPAPRPRRRVPLVLIVPLTLPLLALGACDTKPGAGASESPARPTGSVSGSGATGGTSGTSGTSVPPRTTVPGTTPVPRPPTSGPPGTGIRQVAVSVYFLHGAYVSAAPRTVDGPGTAAGAVRALLAGPRRYEGQHGRTTAIPSGTTLRSIAVRDHVATVDLSGRYDDGGGTVSMRARLAQVVFTVTRHPGIHKVRFELDGKPVTSFGGEGIVLNHPVGREDFEDVSPAVLVESPLIGDSVRTPVRVWGSANTFEAEFQLKVTDASGRTAADVQVLATSGSGTRGTFDVTFPYRATRTGPGVLTAYFYSPKDGKPKIVETVPLTVNR